MGSGQIDQGKEHLQIKYERIVLQIDTISEVPKKEQLKYLRASQL